MSFLDRNLSVVCRRPRCRRRKLFVYFFGLFFFCLSRPEMGPRSPACEKFALPLGHRGGRNLIGLCFKYTNASM